MLFNNWGSFVIFCSLILIIGATQTPESNECPNGYAFKNGDIRGEGTIQGNIEASIEECASLCNDLAICNSFEYHEIQRDGNDGHICDLNRESEPNAPRWLGCIFCSKIGNY